MPDGFRGGDGGEQPFFKVALQTEDLQLIARSWHMQLADLQPPCPSVITLV